jgi:hypothetical protein
MIGSMEGFSFASLLDLNMGYNHSKLDSDAQMLCKIVFPWNMGKYKYNAYALVSRLSGSLCFSKRHD